MRIMLFSAESIPSADFDAGSTVATLAVAAGLAATASWIVARRDGSDKEENENVRRLPPSVPSGMLESLKTFNDKDEFIPTLLEWSRSLDYPCAMTVPLSPAHTVVLLNEPDIVREVLTDKLSKKPHMIYKFLESVRGRSLATQMDDVKWKHSRRGINPAFSAKRIDRMVMICDEIASDWINNFLEPMIDADGSFDPSKEMTKLTISVVFRAIFDYQASRKEVETVLADMNTLAEECSKRIANPFREYVHGMLSSSAAVDAALHRIRGLLRKCLNKYRESTNPTPGTVVELISNNSHYDDDDSRIRDMDAFLLAGFDTTGYSLSWLLFTLAEHPNEMEKVRLALLKLPESERPSCPELHNAVRESMRMNAATSLGSARIAGRDFVTKDGCTIPKGTITFHTHMSVNRNRKVYGEDADEFRPDRWIDADASLKSGLSAFAFGPRNCVGQGLANAELHSVLASLLSKYEFVMEREYNAEFFVTHHPSGGLLKAKRV